MNGWAQPFKDFYTYFVAMEEQNKKE